MSHPEGFYDPRELSDPVERDFELYEQYLIGAIDDAPVIPVGLTERQNDSLYYMRGFLEWKYEDGLGESIVRHPEGYGCVEEIRGLPETEWDESDNDHNANG